MHLVETGLDILNHNKGEYDAPPSSPDSNDGAERNGFYLDSSDSDEHDVFLNPMVLLNVQRIDIQEDSLSSEEEPFYQELWRYHAEQFQRIVEVDRPEIDNESSEMDSSSEHSFELGLGNDDALNSNFSYFQQRASITNARYVNMLIPRDVDRESTPSSNSSLSSGSSQSSNYDAPGDPRYSGGHDGPSSEDCHRHNRQYPDSRPGNSYN